MIARVVRELTDTTPQMLDIPLSSPHSRSPKFLRIEFVVDADAHAVVGDRELNATAVVEFAAEVGMVLPQIEVFDLGGPADIRCRRQPPSPP